MIEEFRLRYKKNETKNNIIEINKHILLDIGCHSDDFMNYNEICEYNQVEGKENMNEWIWVILMIKVIFNLLNINRW